MLGAFRKTTTGRCHFPTKKGKQNFLNAVNKCISRDKITTEMIRKFSRRARQYIAAYYKVWQKNQEQAATATVDLPIVDETTTPVEIEKIIKLFKTHRCAMDFDSSFCKASFTTRSQTS